MFKFQISYKHNPSRGRGGGGGEGEGGVQTCRHGGRLVEEAGGVQAGRWRRPSGAGIMEVARRQELLVAHKQDGGSAPGGVLLPV
jgi:hypothetical protein